MKQSFVKNCPPRRPTRSRKKREAPRKSRQHSPLPSNRSVCPFSSATSVRVNCENAWTMRDYCISSKAHLKEREDTLRGVPPVQVHGANVLPLPICRHFADVKPGVLSPGTAHRQEIFVEADALAEPVAGSRLRKDQPLRFPGYLWKLQNIRVSRGFAWFVSMLLTAMCSSFEREGKKQTAETACKRTDFG